MATMKRCTLIIMSLLVVRTASAGGTAERGQRQQRQAKAPVTTALPLKADNGFSQTIRLKLKVNDRHGAATTEGLVASLKAHPTGRQLVESMGGEVKNLAFISRGQFRTVQKWFRARGLPTPPAGEAGYNLPVNGRVVTAILPGFRTDVETALRELTYQQLLTPFLRDGTIVNKEITRAVEADIDRRFPNITPAERQAKLEIFVRLLGNLRSGVVLGASKEAAPQLANPRYDGFRQSIAQSKDSPTRKIQRLLSTPFTIKGYDQFPYADQEYYGRNLFGVKPQSTRDDAEAERRANAVTLDPALDKLLHPVLDRTDARFWTVFQN